MAIEPLEILDNIKTNISRGKNKPDIDEFYSEIAGRDPAKLLYQFLNMRNSPKRREIGWQRKDLGWMADAWFTAATAAERSRERDEMIRQGEFFRGLQNMLEREELERREEGTLWLEDKDWVHPHVIIKAIEAICHAGMKYVDLRPV